MDDRYFDEPHPARMGLFIDHQRRHGLLPATPPPAPKPITLKPKPVIVTRDHQVYPVEAQREIAHLRAQRGRERDIRDKLWCRSTDLEIEIARVPKMVDVTYADAIEEGQDVPDAINTVITVLEAWSKRVLDAA